MRTSPAYTCRQVALLIPKHSFVTGTSPRTYGVWIPPLWGAAPGELELPSEILQTLNRFIHLPTTRLSRKVICSF